MIIYGTKGMRSKDGAGDFYCPQCSRPSEYDEYKVRRWFTLYFIPLIPMNIAARYLECRSCLGTFKTDARDHGPEHYAAETQKFEAEFHQAMKGTMILMLLADGRIEPQEIQTIQSIYGRLTNQEYGADAIANDINELQRSAPGIKDYLADIASRLNDSGKAMVYQAAVLVALADGDVAKEEEALLKSTSKALGLRHPSYSAILLILMGVNFTLASVWGLICWTTVIVPIVLVRVAAEERMLVEGFGDSYLEYRGHTERLIPAVF